MISTIYNFIGYFIQERLPEIKGYALFNNRVVNESNDRPRVYPSIYLEILPITSVQMLSNYQEMQVDIRLHIVGHLVDTTDWKDTTNTSTSNYFQVVDNVFKQLNGLAAFTIPASMKNADIHINSIKRTGISVGNEFGHLTDTIVSFNFKLFDATAANEIYLTSVENINLEEVEIEK